MIKEDWFNLQIDKHEASLLRYTSRFVNEEMAQEIVQEAFLSLWEEDSSKIAGRELQWLYCVCRNRALNLKNRGQIEKLSSADPALENTPEESIEFKLIRLERDDAVYGILSKLSKHIQEVLRFRFVDGFSYKEISEITGHSISYVGVLIHDGITKVKTSIEKDESQAIKVSNETAE